MKLLSIPGLPDYKVDEKNGVVYRLKYGRLQEVKTRTKYQSFTVTMEGATIGMTLPRAMYCAIHHVDPLKIPSGLCIGMEHGNLVVLDRAMLAKKVAEGKKKNSENLIQVKKNLSMVEMFYDGDTQPLLSYLRTVEDSLVRHFVWTYGLSQERSEIVVGAAINRYLDRLCQGEASYAIRTSVLRFALGENKKMNKQTEFKSNKNYEMV